MGEMNIVPMLPPPPQPRLFDHLRTKRFLYFVLSLLIVVSLAWPQTHGDIDISITRTAEGRNGVPERIAAPDGSVLNVKAYGAKGDGSTDDTSGVATAIDAAAVKGGTIYFPAGKYIIKRALPIIYPHRHSTVSIRCADARSTWICFYNGGITISGGIQYPYKNSSIENCTFDNTKAMPGSVAITIIDSTGDYIRDNEFSLGTSTVGVLIKNVSYWNERHQLSGNQFQNGNPAIEFYQAVTDRNNSFGYNILANDHFEVCERCDGILINGNNDRNHAGFYNGRIDVRANFLGSSGNLLHLINKGHVYQSQLRLSGEGSAGTYLIATDSTSSVAANYGAELYYNNGGTAPIAAGSNVSFTLASLGSLQTGGTAGPTWSSGPGVPSGSCSPNGSLYSNTKGSSGSTLYVCVSGVWVDVR
jgi:hypothetical protein